MCFILSFLVYLLFLGGDIFQGVFLPLQKKKKTHKKNPIATLTLISVAETLVYSNNSFFFS